METANQLLRDWRDINRARGGRPMAAPSRPTPHSPPPPMQQYPSSSMQTTVPPTDYLDDQMGRLKLAGPETVSPKTPEYQYGRPPSQTSIRDGRPPEQGGPPHLQHPGPYQHPMGRPPQAGRPPFPTEPVQQSPQHIPQQTPPQLRPPQADYEAPGTLDAYQVCLRKIL